MKTFAESIVVAFSMYSKIPMPAVSWNERNMKYALAFFPFVGIVIAAVIYGCYRLFAFFDLSPLFFSAVAAAVPIIVTGGIHADGFCDTCDALASNREKEEKLKIMKDPNAGAFAVIGISLMFLIRFGAWNQMFQTPEFMSAVLISYFLSRSLSGLSVAAFPCAKNTGLVFLFAGKADKKTIAILLSAYILISAAAMAATAGLTGCAALIVAAILYLYYYFMSIRQFGGITGDLAGFYLEICETAVLLTAAVGGGIAK